MYKVIKSESSDDIQKDMNDAEKQGFDFVSLAVGMYRIVVIMYREEL